MKSDLPLKKAIFLNFPNYKLFQKELNEGISHTQNTAFIKASKTSNLVNKPVHNKTASAAINNGNQKNSETNQKKIETPKKKIAFKDEENAQKTKKSEIFEKVSEYKDSEKKEENLENLERSQKKTTFHENTQIISGENNEELDRHRSRTHFSKKSIPDLDFFNLPRSKSCDSGKIYLESQCKEIDEMFESLANFQSLKPKKLFFIDFYQFY